ncbi:2-haloacrylate reductase [Sesamum angolense]|uniref:2-haloacrylate reductase n=1 Tax=Sesamum angolense TaxID=2727404 RepID=A0AAE1W1R5_9LAMI|nr:2-haloacrylate reductase [Sesamum angolense]
MVKAIRVHELGGPEVRKWEDVEIGEPKDGEIKVKNKAIGLNFCDTYFRNGFFKASAFPFTPAVLETGMEAVGMVTAVGPGVTGRMAGDLVAYAGYPMGAYAEDSWWSGSLLCQWANALGATVIGTVSTKEKAAQAKEDGCHHVILYKEEDFVALVNEITSGKGVEVVYDSVGKDTFEGSLKCLKLCGHMMSFGSSSGAPDPVPLSSALLLKSLSLTSPNMIYYTITRDELLQTASEVFTNVAAGVLRVRVNHTYPLSQAAQAHTDLESRKTSGSVVLIPDGS